VGNFQENAEGLVGRTEVPSDEKKPVGETGFF